MALCYIQQAYYPHITGSLLLLYSSWLLLYVPVRSHGSPDPGQYIILYYDGDCSVQNQSWDDSQR
jgi:hypothetical protein